MVVGRGAERVTLSLKWQLPLGLDYPSLFTFTFVWNTVLS